MPGRAFLRRLIDLTVGATDKKYKNQSRGRSKKRYQYVDLSFERFQGRCNVFRVKLDIQFHFGVVYRCCKVDMFWLLFPRSLNTREMTARCSRSEINRLVGIVPFSSFAGIVGTGHG